MPFTEGLERAEGRKPAEHYTAAIRSVRLYSWYDIKRKKTEQFVVCHRSKAWRHASTTRLTNLEIHFPQFELPIVFFLFQAANDVVQFLYFRLKACWNQSKLSYSHWRFPTFCRHSCVTTTSTNTHHRSIDCQRIIIFSSAWIVYAISVKICKHPFVKR